MKELKKTPPADGARRPRRAAAVSEPAGAHTAVNLRPATALPSNAALVTAIVDGLQQTQGNRFVQRMVSGLRGPEAQGTLDPATRDRMERQLGEDLSNVRVHAGDAASARAEAADARAITEGEDIYFGAGEYAPDTSAGQALLAHELAHVVQQRPAGSPVAGGVSLEQEAERAEAGAAEGRRTEVARRGVGPTRQRKGKEKEKAKKEEPSVAKHAVEIGPLPPAGSFSAAGRFAIAYVFASGQPQTLTLQVPSGVTTAVTPLSDVSDLKVSDAGAGARAVAIAISPAEALARVQVAFVQGSATYLVIFQFMKAATPPPQPAAAAP